MLSGIGDPAELASHGIEVTVARPAVGRNLQDHPGIGMTWAVRIPTYNSEMARWKQLLHGANWLLRGRGPACTPDAHLVGFLRSDPALDLPDIQVHFTPAGYLVAGEGELILREDSFTAIASICRPRSRGSIGLKSARPQDPPAIRHRLFDDLDDRDRLGRGIRRVREIVRAAPLAEIVSHPLQPDWEDLPDAAMAEYLTAHAGTIYHPSGTCRMGADAESVVDPALRVRGVANLRVADASIMPNVTSGNLNAPCMMIGEKAAELVLASHKAGATVH
jgi:choline dehydrogenase